MIYLLCTPKKITKKLCLLDFREKIYTTQKRVCYAVFNLKITNIHHLVVQPSHIILNTLLDMKLSSSFSKIKSSFVCKPCFLNFSHIQGPKLNSAFHELKTVSA